jgi:cytochrome c-type biogenesis protein CcmH/NrfF
MSSEPEIEPLGDGDQPVARELPLIRCAICASDLVQPSEVAQEAGRVLVRRRCPECGHQDLVEADADAVHAWLRREALLRVQLGRTADRIARAPRVEFTP